MLVILVEFDVDPLPMATAPDFQVDQTGHTVRRADLLSGMVTTIAGLAGTSGLAEGIGSGAMFNSPTGIAMDAAGSMALVVSSILYPESTTIHSPRSQVINLPLSITTIHSPQADHFNNRIRRINVSTGTVTTLAGNSGGIADGVGTAASFGGPCSVAMDGAATLAVVVSPCCYDALYGPS